jgi:hypothetical protein
MAEILVFSRNRCTSVEQMDDRIFRATCRVQDTLREVWVEILVKAPDLEIIQVKGEIKRSPEEKGRDVTDDLQKLTGSRVGPGIKKIIRGLLGHLAHAEQVATLVDECCNGVILSFTKDVLVHAPKDKVGEKEFFAGMVRTNPRLYNSCAALSADSPLMEGLELDKDND